MKDPNRDQQIESICQLIENLSRAGISAAKYNLNIIGIPRTLMEPGRCGSMNASFRWDKADKDASPTIAGVVNKEKIGI